MIYYPHETSQIIDHFIDFTQKLAYINSVKVTLVKQRLFSCWTEHFRNKKAVLSQRWPRDAPYIWVLVGGCEHVSRRRGGRRGSQMVPFERALV